MTAFLIRSLSDPRGFVTTERPDATLPRTAEESYVPWALTHAGQVVYARYGEHRGWRGGGGAGGATLRPYDTLVSQDRRRLAESELGMYALQVPEFTRQAVDKVSDGIRQYHDLLYVTDRARLVDTIYTQIGHYFFTAGGNGFGRISQQDKAVRGPEGVRRAIMAKLATGSLDQKLAIHDAFGRKVLTTLKGGPLATYLHWGPMLRQGWFDDRAKRGRVDLKGALPTRTGGIVPGAQAGRIGTTGQARVRGVDAFARDRYRTPESAANDYYDDLDARNLLFGAGISGTTGTLLQAAFAFAGVLRGDLLKQYVFAIIGYLVGGGMHSYHESMAVARKAGIAYVSGAYLASLPQAFTMSPQCRAWRAAYYDVVVLGATHWRHNTPGLPSHLNRELGNRPGTT